MSVHRVKEKGAFCFSFNRTIRGKQVRVTKLLPKDWSSAQADAYDIKETARLYALHSGIAHSRPSIEQAVLLYLENHVPELKTAQEYIDEYARLYPLYAEKDLTELAAVCATINKLKISAATRRKKIRMLSAACNYAFKYHNLGDTLPSTRVVIPKVKNARNTIPERIEMLRIARRTKRRDARAAIIVAYYSGMRQGEIRKAVVQHNMFRLYDTKNGEERMVPIHPRLNVYLKQFPMCIEKHELYWQWKYARDSLGLGHLHFHDLRHSAATEMINNGVDLHTVGVILGHKDNRSTQIYAYLLAKTLLGAIQKIGGYSKKSQTEEVQ